MGHYQVLFSGEIAHQANQDVVRTNLARELGLDERKVKQLFSGRTVVVRSQLARDEAEKLQERLAGIGAICRVKDLTPRNEDRAEYYRAEKERPEHTLGDITAAHVECPRCGRFQLEVSHCAHCGVDIAAALKQKHQEDLLIEKKIRELRGQQGVAPEPVRNAPARAEAAQEVRPRPSAARPSPARAETAHPQTAPPKPVRRAAPRSGEQPPRPVRSAVASNGGADAAGPEREGRGLGRVMTWFKRST